MNNVLLLNADWSPIQVLAWERATCLVLDKKVLVVAGYENRQIRSPGFSMPWPAVVTLKRYVRIRLNVGMTRRNVLARDGFACQYCDLQPRSARGRPLIDELTVDHVVPRSRAREAMVVLPWSGKRVGVSSWENMVASCVRCNQRKGARTPKEASMPLRRTPTTPNYSSMVSIALSELQIPTEWRAFLPEETWNRSQVA
ncbi:MAG: 5-methylcytosine-specific restriction endonuclease McrA [Myxococcota bacterium]|jgi:5-methylcytosine-specific restriction endonuclease McrA